MKILKIDKENDKVLIEFNREELELHSNHLAEDDCLISVYCAIEIGIMRHRLDETDEQAQRQIRELRPKFRDRVLEKIIKGEEIKVR